MQALHSNDTQHVTQLMHISLMQALHTNDTLEDLQVAWNCIVVSPVPLFTTSLTLFTTCLSLFTTSLSLFTSGLELHRRESCASFHNFPMCAFFHNFPSVVCLFSQLPYVCLFLQLPYVCLFSQLPYVCLLSQLPQSRAPLFTTCLSLFTTCPIPSTVHTPFIPSPSIFVYMGWLRLIGCFKIYVSLQNIGLFCRALLH